MVTADAAVQSGGQAETTTRPGCLAAEEATAEQFKRSQDWKKGSSVKGQLERTESETRNYSLVSTKQLESFRVVKS